MAARASDLRPEGASGASCLALYCPPPTCHKLKVHGFHDCILSLPVSLASVPTALLHSVCSDLPLRVSLTTLPDCPSLFLCHHGGRAAGGHVLALTLPRVWGVCWCDRLAPHCPSFTLSLERSRHLPSGHYGGWTGPKQPEALLPLDCPWAGVGWGGLGRLALSGLGCLALTPCQCLQLGHFQEQSPHSSLRPF